jgi:hypothetical protein
LTIGPSLLLYGPLAPGGVPERSKGTDCKSVANGFGGSNPPPTIFFPRWSVSLRAAAPESPKAMKRPGHPRLDQ